jgi:membrane protease YdiL (CAAX protease family)
VNDLLLATLPKVLLPAFTIAIMLIVAKRKGLSLSDGLGLRMPEPKFAIIFLVGWICLIALEEYATQGVAGTEVKAWPAYPPLILGLRILAVGMLGPISEELVFRGLLLRIVSRTRVGIYGAIVIIAAVWSALHVGYAPIFLAQVFTDGILLGLARHFSKSLYVPIAMHMIGNLFSIYQSLSP